MDDGERLRADRERLRAELELFRRRYLLPWHLEPARKDHAPGVWLRARACSGRHSQPETSQREARDRDDRMIEL